MAITINGTDGSIGGLVAGGLPNVSVIAADLAVGAARSNFGAGAVLQVVSSDLPVVDRPHQQRQSPQE
jgi:hypothetical protein